MLFFRQILFSASFTVAFFSSFSAFSQGTIGSSLDCSDVSVQYSDNADLTREERLELMDKALFSSLNKFELCQSARNGNAGQAGDAAQSSEPGDSGETGAFQGQSVATSGVSGTDAPQGSMQTGDLTETDMMSSSSSEEQTSKAEDKKYEALYRGSGKQPEDIPEAANDDALAAQIRYAAENEPDPVKKAQLWKEYRKYKGLPEK